MGHAALFDTLQYVKKLEEAGVPTRQAEVQAETLAEFFEGEVATKRDLKELEMTLTLKIAESKSETVKWVAGLLLAQAAVIATLVKLL